MHENDETPVEGGSFVTWPLIYSRQAGVLNYISQAIVRLLLLGCFSSRINRRTRRLGDVGFRYFRGLLDDIFQGAER